jgi:hypothetical protein
LTVNRNADKHLNNTVFQFTRYIKREYGAIVYMLVGFKREGGKPSAVQMEFNEDLGLAENFRDAQNTRQIFSQFRTYVYEAFQEGGEGEDVTVPKHHQQKDLMPMERNNFYEPILPDPSTRSTDEARGDWYCRVIRSYFTYHYGKSNTCILSPIF